MECNYWIVTMPWFLRPLQLWHGLVIIYQTEIYHVICNCIPRSQTLSIKGVHDQNAGFIQANVSMASKYQNNSSPQHCTLQANPLDVEWCRDQFGGDVDAFLAVLWEAADQSEASMLKEMTTEGVAAMDGHFVSCWHPWSTLVAKTTTS